MGKINSYSLIDGIEGHEDDLLVLETFEGTRTVTPGQITAAIEGEVTEIKEDLNELINGGIGGGSGIPSAEKQNFAKSIRQEIAFVSTSHTYADAFLSWLESESDTPVTPPTGATLTGITVTWSAESADVGTNPSTLISSVKANYSDGTSNNVTGYTVSPSSLVEGSNTVTVTYQDKTATKTITGIAETTGDWSDWESGVPYIVDVEANEYYDKGIVSSYNGWNRTGYLPCYGASRIEFICTANLGYYNFFFDADKNKIGDSINVQFSSDTQSAVVPSDAYYVSFSGSAANLSKLSEITPYA